MATSTKKSVLFICLGNICRSPIAEAVFLHQLKERGIRDQWHVDSAALGDWHTGCPPDNRAMNVLSKHNVQYEHFARTVTKKDFKTFDFIFGMDTMNIKELESVQPSGATAKVLLLGEYDPEKELIIKDPYYGSGSKGFDVVYDQCVRCCAGFLDKES